MPKSAHSGHIMVLLSHGRHTSSYGPIYIYRHALHPPVPKNPPATTTPIAGAPGGTAFEGQGMWIWYVSQSGGGSLASIVAQAHAADVSTVFVKSSDGSTNYWSQFSPELVQQLHAAGLHVCAWQYVYGTSPAGEASLGAKAVATGADCLVIDAEAEYEGRYGSAQTYIADLRAEIGPSYPLGLASFPYVNYHTSFPYSVFLGPNGAQFNAPQMYWKDIGTSVDTVYANTYIANRVYGRPDLSAGPDLQPPLQRRTGALPRGGGRLRRDRHLVVGLAGNPRRRLDRAGEPAEPADERHPEPRLHRTGAGRAAAIRCCGCRSISRARSRLRRRAASSTRPPPPTSSSSSPPTGSPPSGKTEAATWQALLALPPVAVNWTGGGPSGG